MQLYRFFCIANAIDHRETAPFPHSAVLPARVTWPDQYYSEAVQPLFFSLPCCPRYSYLGLAPHFCHLFSAVSSPFSSPFSSPPFLTVADIRNNPQPQQNLFDHPHSYHPKSTSRYNSTTERSVVTNERETEQGSQGSDNPPSPPKQAPVYLHVLVVYVPKPPLSRLFLGTETDFWGAMTTAQLAIITTYLDDTRQRALRSFVTVSVSVRA